MKSTRIGERMSAKLSIFYPNPTSSPLRPLRPLFALFALFTLFLSTNEITRISTKFDSFDYI